MNESWMQILTVVGANIAAFMWARAEAANDRREVAIDRRDMINIFRSIQEEMKDFHTRLLMIEKGRS